MAKHWAVYGRNLRQASQKLRLDPCHLPQSICYQSPNSGQYFSAFLTERGIFIQKAAAKAGKADVLKIFPPSCFLGIAARKLPLTPEAEAQKAFCLWLAHEEEDYSVPLLVSAHKDDVVLDWRLWADSYNLPMLIMEETDRLRPLGSQAMLKLFVNDCKMPQKPQDFSLRCRGLSLNTRLVLANQVMLG